ncbi:hypothetical protein C7J88_04155 [Staphylococcus muscae]|uniref:Uncharacterized protein n=1 Tax=Staphylococcus muscae TaxID=1294 RepID=A0A240C6E2_9STAP|nr:hypothetical protein [Staphylococcus muscae]AVQ33402.1 hypothetical protein C7J88_04155 [Staphylococcus muscae]PNZ03270.1 hypothetical protein CD131_06655 [Staphylococcus muscae]GGA89882.1 hypothetical protein GCM10007183_12640 [Staphylococcus muscae]SNW03182.1 Uncharacterised protein [Staphylococcus muscae]
MEMRQPKHCNNAPKQQKLFDYVKQQMLDMHMEKVDVIYLMSHGKLASMLCFACKEGQTHKVAYFAEFQSHKKDSDIKSIERIGY